MLHEFITDNRERIVAMARTAVGKRLAPRPTANELEHGVPLFLTQLVELLRPQARSHEEVLGATAAARGGKFLSEGFTVGQVVHDYGEVCQAITSLALEMGAPITVQEFRALNLSLDDAIARAVTEYAQQRDRMLSHDATERLAVLGHELRDLLSTASLAYEILRRGTVGVSGSTGDLLGRSLAGLRELVDRTLALARLEQGALVVTALSLAELVEEIEIGVMLEAQDRGVSLVIRRLQADLEVAADRQVLAVGIARIVSDALAATPRGGEVSVRTRASVDRIYVEVADGGIAAKRGGEDGASTIASRAISAHGGLLRPRVPTDKGGLTTLELPRLVVVS